MTHPPKAKLSGTACRRLHETQESTYNGYFGLMGDCLSKRTTSSMSQICIAREIDRFVRTGNYDVLFRGWPGRHTLESIELGSQTLSDALLKEVRRREAEVSPNLIASPSGDELIAFTRAKVEPMVRGLFSRKEAEPVLALLERSVVILTPEHIGTHLQKADLDNAWGMADMYLGSIGAQRLDPQARRAVGFSAETTCYVSLEYFSDDHPFADYVVHETAHMFHNNKRRTIGLPATRRRQWLLSIEFAKRETFAYACEAYSRILGRAKRPAERSALLEEVRQYPLPPTDQVDRDEYFAILREAVARRNGWKAILEACSPPRS